MTSDLGFENYMPTFQADVEVDMESFVQSLLSLDDYDYHLYRFPHEQQPQEEQQKDKEAAMAAQQHMKMENEEALKKISDFLMDDNYEQPPHIEEHRVLQYMAELDKEIPKKQTSSSSASSSSSSLMSVGSKRKIHSWTKEEHLVFLRGVEKYGWGSWKRISETFLPGRTQYQLASHAQKFKMHHDRQEEKPAAKRRRKSSSSIYDITTI